MDDLGEILALGGIIWFIFSDHKPEVWPYCLAMVVIGAALYFIDRALKN